VFLSEAAAYVYGEAPDVLMADAVRGAVARRLEWLDANFLAAINGYMAAAAKLGNQQLVDLLVTLREEVLAQVRSGGGIGAGRRRCFGVCWLRAARAEAIQHAFAVEPQAARSPPLSLTPIQLEPIHPYPTRRKQVTLRMPPSVRVLDAALQHDGISLRLKVLRTALAGGKGDVPAVDMESLSATANQFVDDMEDQEVRGWVWGWVGGATGGLRGGMGCQVYGW